MTAWQRGNFDEARSYLDRCLQAVRRAGGQEWKTLAPMNPPYMPFAAGSSQFELLPEETWILLRSVDRHAVEAYTLAHLGSLARCQGDFVAARAFQEEARQLFTQHDDREGMAQMAGQQGNLARVEGDYETARARLDESLRLRRALGDRRGIFIAVCNLGLLAVAEGEYQRAEELYARSHAYCVKYGDAAALEMVISLQAHLAFVQEDYQLAREFHEQVLALKRESAYSTFDEARIQAHLGEIALKRGDTAAARASYAMCLANLERLGNADAATAIRTKMVEIDARAFEQSRAAIPGDTGA
jgi:tetratricopeptide (TPR) repeat protein